MISKEIIKLKRELNNTDDWHVFNGHLSHNTKKNFYITWSEKFQHINIRSGCFGAKYKLSYIECLYIRRRLKQAYISAVFNYCDRSQEDK